MYELGNGQGFLIGFFSGGECLIANTREQISAFIMDSWEEDEVIITNIRGEIEITTLTGLIFKCPNQAFCLKLIEVLAPQQMGDVEPIPFVPYEYPKVLILIRALFERGFQCVHVEISRDNEHIKCYIEDKQDSWSLSSVEILGEIPIEADSLEELVLKMEDVGWTSLHVIETIKAETEQDVQCVCGNDINSDGYYPCDSEGNEVEPAPNWGNLVICPRCGIIFDNESYDSEAQTYTIVGVGKFNPRSN